MSRNMKRPRGETASAAEWFVALDSSAPDEVGAARFAAWLDRAAEHEVELERCDAAVEIARGLADDPELRWAYDEAAALAKRDPAASRGALSRRRAWFGWAALAAAAGVAAVVAPWLAHHTRSVPSVAIQRAQTAADPFASASAAERRAAVAAAAAQYPIVRLPSGVVVDAGSVAVLPFGFATDETRASGELAAALSREIGTSLAALPGIYVVGWPQANAYLGTELSAADVGDQLGVRGVLYGEIAEHEGQIHVAARLLDAATGGQVWFGEFDRAAADVDALADEMGTEIIAALVDPQLRARAVAATSLRDARADNRPTSVQPDSAVQ
jgi:TolB-like protein